jgi:hypothetical protein
MSHTAEFKVFCLECYKSEHHLTGKETLRLFKEYGVLDYLGANYDVLHRYGGGHLVQDIEQFIQARRQAGARP